MKHTTLAPGLTVSGQLDAADLDRLAREGVRRVVNVRPDGEKPAQLPATEAARIAAENGMQYRHIPVTMQSLSIEAVHAFGEAIAGDTVVHAHCGSGLRAATLWGLDQVFSGKLDRAAVSKRVAEAGFDLAPGLAWLDAQSGGKAA